MGKLHRRWAALALALTAFVTVLGLAPSSALADANVSNADALKEAVAEGGVVVLDENITVSDQLTIANNVTLDLNGKTLTLQGSASVADEVSDTKHPAALVNSGSLTISNGTIDVTSEANGVYNTGTLTVEPSATVKCSSEVFHNFGVIRNMGGTVTTAGTLDSAANNGIVTFGGTVNVSGGKVSALYVSGNDMGSALLIFNRAYDNESAGAQVTISDGELSSYGYVASTNNLYSGGENGSSLTVSGGTLTSYITSIYWPSSGTLTIGVEGSSNGPTITSTNGSGIEFCSGTLNVYGGAISGGTNQGEGDSVVMSEDLVNAYRNNSGSASMGDAITVIARRGTGYVTSSLAVNIEGGTFKSGQNYGVRYLDCNVAEGNQQFDQEVDVAIAGGDFSGKIAAVNADFVPVEDRSIITGGTFSSDVSAYVPEDYELSEDGTVAEKPDVAMIGTTPYKSLEDAIATAKDGDTIDLVADAKLQQSLVLDARVTINGNGHTITADSDFVPTTAFSGRGASSLLTVRAGGSGSTIKNVSMVGTAKTTHVLNVVNDTTDKPAMLTLTDVTLNHSASGDGAPLIASHFNVTANGKFEVVTGPSSWYGINLEGKYGETSLVLGEDCTPVFTDASGKSLKFMKVENTATSGGATPTFEIKNPALGETNEGNGNFSFHTHDSSVIKDYVAPTTKSEGYSGDLCCSVCGQTMQKGEIIPKLAPGEIVMFRLYNPNSGEHFYTSSEYERDSVIKAGWSYEGVGWIAPDEGDPVYRLYNPNAGDHHYTMSAYERDSLVKAGWRYEGIGWYSADKETGVPLLREYNPNATTGTHNYTVSEYEHDHLVSVGWNDEGIAWYAVK